jgi:hypothetical protein
MRLVKLNTMILAFVFSLLIEGIGLGIYRWASAFSPDTIEDTFCDLYIVVHMPAVRLAQIFYPPSHWPDVGAHILFCIFALCECWIFTFDVIWIFCHFYRRSYDNNKAV